MARGRSGVISKEYKGEDNTAYHDVIKLFKIYRVVNWQMQIKISQVKRRFHMEYGTDVDEFLDTIYQAGMMKQSILCEGIIRKASDTIGCSITAIYPQQNWKM